MITDKKKWVNESVEKINRKLLLSRERAQFKIPSGAVDGQFDDMIKEHQDWGGIAYWTNGFWAGIMWLLYEETKDERYAEVARFTETILDKAMEVSPAQLARSSHTRFRSSVHSIKQSVSSQLEGSRVTSSRICPRISSSVPIPSIRPVSSLWN